MASAAVIDAQNPLCQQPGFFEGPALLGFSVYSGAMQYGVLNGRGCKHLCTYAVTLDRLNDGPGADLAARAACHELRQLAYEIYELFNE